MNPSRQLGYRSCQPRSSANPEKLGHLGPLADVRALLREIRES